MTLLMLRITLYASVFDYSSTRLGCLRHLTVIALNVNSLNVEFSLFYYKAIGQITAPFCPKKKF